METRHDVSPVRPSQTAAGTRAGFEPAEVVGEYTLAGWSPQTAIIQPQHDRRVRRLHLMSTWVGIPAAVGAAVVIVAFWQSPADPMTLAILGLLALVAQYFPVNLSSTNVSLGVGFLLAACLLGGPVAGPAVVGLVYLVWTPTRRFLPWFVAARTTRGWRVVIQTLYHSGLGVFVYLAATSAAFTVFGLTAPVDEVRTDTVGASIVLTVTIFLLQNGIALGVMALAGDDPRQSLRAAVAGPALVEFIALPAALLLVVVRVALGWPAFLLLSWLSLMAAFLGWRSWQDRETLKRRLEDLEVLHRVGALLSGTLEIGEVVRRLHDVVREVATFERMLLVIQDAEDHVSQVYSFDAEGHRGVVSTASIEDTEARPEGLFFEDDGSAVFTSELYLSESSSFRARLDFGAEDLPSATAMVLLETILQQAGTALSNARLYRLANTDPLTGLAIRRYFERALRSSATRQDRYAVIMLDLDWFKQVNDTHGHKAGDAVLQDVADLLTGSLRVMDVAARYGGEEFVVLLPGTSSPVAAAVAERMRRALEQRSLALGDDRIDYTASFGVAASEDVEDATDPMECVWRADAALLEAKRAGRNQVVTWRSLDT
jgi:diguanylate cyclase (GGDEF)-like protein